jgi:hypothetical protein
MAFVTLKAITKKLCGRPGDSQLHALTADSDVGTPSPHFHSETESESDGSDHGSRGKRQAFRLRAGSESCPPGRRSAAGFHSDSAADTEPGPCPDSASPNLKPPPARQLRPGRTESRTRADSRPSSSSGTDRHGAGSGPGGPLAPSSAAAGRSACRRRADTDAQQVRETGGSESVAAILLRQRQRACLHPARRLAGREERWRRRGGAAAGRRRRGTRRRRG